MDRLFSDEAFASYSMVSRHLAAQRPGLKAGKQFVKRWSIPISGKDAAGELAICGDTVVIMRDGSELVDVDLATGVVRGVHHPGTGPAWKDLSPISLVDERHVHCRPDSESKAKDLLLDLDTGKCSPTDQDFFEKCARRPYEPEQAFRNRHPSLTCFCHCGVHPIATEIIDGMWWVHVGDQDGEDIQSWQTPWSEIQCDRLECKPAQGSVYLLHATMSLAHRRPHEYQVAIADPREGKLLNEPIIWVYANAGIIACEEPVLPSRICWAGGRSYHGSGPYGIPEKLTDFERYLVVIDPKNGEVQRHHTLLHKLEAIGPGWVAGFATDELAKSGWFEIIDVNTGACQGIPSTFGSSRLRGVVTAHRLFLIQRHRAIEAWEWLDEESSSADAGPTREAGSWGLWPERSAVLKRRQQPIVQQDPPVAVAPVVCEEESAAEKFVWAVRGGEVATLEARYQGLAMLDHVSPKFGDAFTCAVRRGQIDIFNWLLTKRAPNRTPHKDTDLVALAINGGHVEIVRTLLDRGIRPLAESSIKETALALMEKSIPGIRDQFLKWGMQDKLWMDDAPSRYLHPIPADHPARQCGTDFDQRLTAIGWWEDTTSRFQNAKSSDKESVGQDPFMVMNGVYLGRGVHPEDQWYRTRIPDGLKPLPFCAGPAQMKETWSDPQHPSEATVTVSFSLNRRLWSASWKHRAPFIAPEFMCLFQEALWTVEPTARLAIIQDNGERGRLVVHREAILTAARDQRILALDLIRRDGTAIECF